MTADREALLLGIDIGTTAVKAAAYTLNGELVGRGSKEYELLTTGGSVEVRPETYWEAIVSSVRQVLAAHAAPGHIQALSLSCQGETLLPLGRRYEPLRNAIVWLDSRAVQESEDLALQFSPREFYEVTGQTSMLPTWPAAKLRWLSRNEPDTFAKTAKFVLLEDYLLYRLTGELVTEGLLATSTCYWDFRSGQWWPQMLAALDVSVEHLPQLVESGTQIGGLTPEAADQLGLPAGIAVCAGALDQACGAIGAGNVTPGRLSENTGAAVALCSTVDEPTLDPAGRIPCHYHGIPGRYMLHTFTAGGVILQWFRDELAGPELAEANTTGVPIYDILDRQADRADPGCNGLIAIPHFQGAMPPDANAQARGAFVGLTLSHSRADLLRAVMESVIYVVRRNVEVFSEVQSRPPTGIWSLGGGAKSELWKQMEADVLQMPVTTTQDHDAACLGAAMLAGAGTGAFTSIPEAAASMVRIGKVYEPDARRKDVYDDAYHRFRRVAEALWPQSEAGARP